MSPLMWTFRTSRLTATFMQEIFTHKPYTSKVDNYALGCILYLMITGTDYLPGAKIERVAIAKRYSAYVVLPLFNLLSALLSPEPEKRPDFSAIYPQIKHIRSPPLVTRALSPLQRSLLAKTDGANSPQDLSDWQKWFSCRPTFITLILCTLAVWVVGTFFFG